MEHQARTPLGHCPRDVINLKNAPPLGHSQAPPPLGHCPCDVIHIFQGWNKIAKGWNKIAEGWNKIAKGWNKIAERWNKIAKGWNKIFGMGNWGGRTTPPTPPLATGLTYILHIFDRVSFQAWLPLYSTICSPDRRCRHPADSKLHHTYSTVLYRSKTKRYLYQNSLVDFYKIHSYHWGPAPAPSTVSMVRLPSSSSRCPQCVPSLTLHWLRLQSPSPDGAHEPSSAEPYI